VDVSASRCGACCFTASGNLKRTVPNGLSRARLLRSRDKTRSIYNRPHVFKVEEIVTIALEDQVLFEIVMASFSA
jgi:hypothetical protein